MEKLTLQNQIKFCLKHHYAMPAINVQTVEHLAILADFSERNKAPLIAQFSARFIDFFDRVVGLKNLLNLTRQKSSTVYFHLDHCDDFNTIHKCIDAGFDAVMYDGSHNSIEENIKGTNEVLRMARAKNVLVEGEVGAISGVEDGFGVEAGDYADLDEALHYYNSTGVEMLALAIGNAHGFYTSTNGIRIEMLANFKKKAGKTIPLVLHGGTGIPFEIVQESIKSGVVKVNYSTDFKKIHQTTVEEESSHELFNGIRFYDCLNRGMSEKLTELTKELKICT